jgi:hypothetical protein
MVVSGIHFVSGCSELSYRSYRMSQYIRVGELRSFWLLVAIVARTGWSRGVLSILLVASVHQHAVYVHTCYLLCFLVKRKALFRKSK